ncbi:hypothetical protein F511_33335 [Dorcoceras hygrometricum]|uniref:Uncharacterized protein n=1 Tax=Dorcoceras hygrometricum TaxID=472368 RepID=A0A2Z7A7U1_9LAMI|nr:hypothetical protein F511_33335 [Dorcoceras hygrometricum]
MVAINTGLKVNWASLLFNILTAMVATPAKQSHGCAMQLSRLLEKFPGIDLRESTDLHPLKVLNTKSIHTYRLKNVTTVSEFTMGKRHIVEGEKKEVAEKMKAAKDVRAAELKQGREENKRETAGGQAAKKKKFASEDLRTYWRDESYRVEDIAVEHQDPVEISEHQTRSGGGNQPALTEISPRNTSTASSSGGGVIEIIQEGKDKSLEAVKTFSETRTDREFPMPKSEDNKALSLILSTAAEPRNFSNCGHHHQQIPIPPSHHRLRLFQLRPPSPLPDPFIAASCLFAIATMRNPARSSIDHHFRSHFNHLFSSPPPATTPGATFSGRIQRLRDNPQHSTKYSVVAPLSTTGGQPSTPSEVVCRPQMKKFSLILTSSSACLRRKHLPITVPPPIKCRKHRKPPPLPPIISLGHTSSRTSLAYNWEHLPGSSTHTRSLMLKKRNDAHRRTLHVHWGTLLYIATKNVE